MRRTRRNRLRSIAGGLAALALTAAGAGILAGCGAMWERFNEGGIVSSADDGGDGKSEAAAGTSGATSEPEGRRAAERETTAAADSASAATTGRGGSARADATPVPTPVRLRVSPEEAAARRREERELAADREAELRNPPGYSESELRRKAREAAVARAEAERVAASTPTPAPTPDPSKKPRKRFSRVCIQDFVSIFDDAKPGSIPPQWQVDGKPPRDGEADAAAGARSADPAWRVAPPATIAAFDRYLEARGKPTPGNAVDWQVLAMDTPDLGELEARVRVRFPAAPGAPLPDRCAGVAFRMTAERTFWIAAVNPMRSEVNLFKVENGKKVRAERARAVVPVGTWIDIDVRQSGQQLLVSVDGRALLFTSDGERNISGRVGIAVEEGLATDFDDFEVCCFSAPESGTSFFKF